jgi:hypothetical protein
VKLLNDCERLVSDGGLGVPLEMLHREDVEMVIGVVEEMTKEEIDK